MISKTLYNFRASSDEKRNNASSSLIETFMLFNTESCSKARFSKIRKSSASRDFSTYTWQRDNKGEITSKEGFSVVAPINVTVPFSTAPNKESCCDLLKR